MKHSDGDLPSVTLSTQNFTWTDLGSKQGLRCKPWRGPLKLRETMQKKKKKKKKKKEEEEEEEEEEE
jgi:hypothetical protein